MKEDVLRWKFRDSEGQPANVKGVIVPTDIMVCGCRVLLELNEGISPEEYSKRRHMAIDAIERAFLPCDQSWESHDLIR